MAVQTPFIDTRIGTGGAVVLQRNNNTEDLKELAYTAGYNSEGAKKRRITNNITNQAKDFQPEMKGLLPVQVTDIEENLKTIKETISTGKFLEEHGSNAPQVAEDMLYEFRNTIELHRSAAAETNTRLNSYASLNPNDIENYDALKGTTSPDYSYSPSSDGIPRKLKGRDLAAAIQADARSANQIFKNEYEVPTDFVFNKADVTVNKGGKSVQNVNYQIDEPSQQRAATINSNRLKSAMAQKAGQAPLNAQEDITYFEDVEDFIIENHKSEFNGATEDERTAMRFKYGTEFLIDKARGVAKKEDSETIDPLKLAKPDKSKLSDKEIATAKNVKDLVNKFQDDKNVGPINQFLAPYGLKADLSGDNVRFYKESFDKDDNPKRSFETGNIAINDAEAIYNVIAKNNPFVDREAIDQVDFSDPNSNQNSTQYKDVQPLVERILKAYENDKEDEAKEWIKEFGDDVSYNVDNIIIAGEKYSLTDKEDAKKAYKALQERGVEKGLKSKGKAANASKFNK
jgi:hypothetical protein